MKSLEEIGTKYGTDKVEHRYLSHYEAVLGHLRDKSIKMLEIGVFRGQSLLMWHEYFQNAEVHGADIDFSLSEKNLEGNPRIRIHLMNCDFTSDLKTFARSNKDFDVIVDDGGHTMRQQQLAMKVLWKSLVPGGIFIMEDLHTSLKAHYPSHNRDNEPTTLELLEGLESGSTDFQSHYLSKKDVEEIAGEVESCRVIWSREAEGRVPPSITSVLRKKF